MRQETYILANAGIAIFKKEKEWLTIDSKDLNQVKSIHPFDLNTLLLSHSEVITLNNNTSVEKIKESLQNETEKQEALTTALQFMDLSI